MQAIIQNFQSIKEAKLNIKGFTLLIGESSAGKSACMRALYSATHNRFKQGQVRYGEDHATVRIRFPEESKDILTVTRPWAGSVKMSLGTQSFSKINRTLPKEVSEFLNFGVLDVAGDSFSLNFYDQFQKPLLLEYSQKKVMDILSTSKALDDLNLTKDYLSKVRLENKGAFKVVSGILDDAKVGLSDVKSKVDSCQSLMDSLDFTYTDLQEVESKLTFVEGLEYWFNELCKVVQVLESKTKFVDALGNLISEESSVEDTLSCLSSLLSFVNLHNTVVGRLKLLQIYVEDYTEEYQIVINSVGSLSSLLFEFRRLDNKQKVLQRIDTVGTALFAFKDSVGRLGTLSDFVDSYKDVNSRIVELEDVVINHICPVCHSKVE